MPKGKIEVEESGGNIFADLELPDADELLLKAQLVSELRRLAEELSLTQTAAARLTGVAQPDLSNLLRGQLRGFSVERIMRMLTALGQDLEILVRPHAPDGKAGRITVDMTREPVDRSAVASIGYEGGAKMLEIAFASGEVYQYFNVPESVYGAFRKADSKGAFFQDRIRGRFPYARAASERVPGSKLSAGSPSSARRA